MNKETTPNMDKKASKDKNAQPRPRGNLWDLLTWLILLNTILISAYFLFIYLNPTSNFNPFPPPIIPEPISIVIPETETSEPSQPTATMPQTKVELSATPLTVQETTAQLLNENPTPEVAQTIIIENSPMPANLAEPTITFTPNSDIIMITPIPDTMDPGSLFWTPTATLRVDYLYEFVLQGEPQGISASSFNPNRACDWMGVGGQVFDLLGGPATGLNIQIGGVFEDKPFYTQTSLTGTAPQYGLGGYEFSISDKPSASYLSLWVRLVDQEGNALSARVQFNTYNDCSKNLILINFKQVR